MTKIYLRGKNNDKFALVNSEDYEWLSQYKWYLSTRGYAMARKNTSSIFMHRLICNPPESKIIDHINGNLLDNQRVNLRVANYSQNGSNSKMNKNNKSGYRGVCFDRRNKRFVAQITINKKVIKLGYFISPTEAASVYNNAAKKYHGRFATLNILT